MRVTIPRVLLTAVAAVFCLFIVVLGIISLDVPRDPGPAIVALLLFVTATAVSLAPLGQSRMPLLLAVSNVVVVVALCLLVTSQLLPSRLDDAGYGYATWHVGASGALLTITATRGRVLPAVAGAAFLIVHTAVWAGPLAVVGIGVIGSVTWVAIAVVIGRGITRAGEDAARFARAAREATDWRALQEAHIFERQVRIAHTNAMALQMLRTIERAEGRLDDGQRAECLLLEAAVRDEIRGRYLLDDRVRDLVREARAEGVVVNLLDEGGLDELPPPERSRVLAHIALALASRGAADRLVIRSVPEGDVAATVVGVRAAGDDCDEGDDDEIVIWLEIPRRAETL